VKDKNTSLLEFFLRDYLPGILIFVLIMLVVTSIHVKKIATRLNEPMKPVIEVSAGGDTTYIYEMHNNDTTDVTFNITFE
jgi:hypothetical protein